MLGLFDHASVIIGSVTNSLQISQWRVAINIYFLLSSWQVRRGTKPHTCHHTVQDGKAAMTASVSWSHNTTCNDRIARGPTQLSKCILKNVDIIASMSEVQKEENISHSS